jgi:hypothetical protein
MENRKVKKIEFGAPSGKVIASLLSVEDSSKELAVVLPGAGYSCDMPLLYYSIDTLLLKGYQVLAVEKIYADDSKWRSLESRETAFKYVAEDSLEVFSQISSQFSNQVKVLLGRSLGTYQIACVVEERIITPRQIVWQTPSLYEKWPLIKDCGIPGFGIIGTLDHRYETAIPYFPEYKIVIEGADHSMEIPGDPIQSIKALEKVIRGTDAWLQKASR